jgi:hypothetical protein
LALLLAVGDGDWLLYGRNDTAAGVTPQVPKPPLPLRPPGDTWPEKPSPAACCHTGCSGCCSCCTLHGEDGVMPFRQLGLVELPSLVGEHARLPFE